MQRFQINFFLSTSQQRLVPTQKKKKEILKTVSN